MKLRGLRYIIDGLINEGYGDFEVDVTDSVYGYTIGKWDVDYDNKVILLLPDTAVELITKNK
jgi:hypothetical protein